MAQYRIVERPVTLYELVDERGKFHCGFESRAEAERAVRRMAALERIEAAAANPTADPATCAHPERVDMEAVNGSFWGCPACGAVVRER